MKVLTIRLDDDTHARVKEAAEQDARSLNGEINWLLKAGLVAAGTLSTERGSDDPKPGTAAASSPAAGAARGQRARLGYSKKQQTGRKS